MFLHAPFHAVLAEAVTFLHAQGQKCFNIAAEPAENAPHQRAGGDAIDIVIAENDHLFAGGDGLEHAFRGAPEVGQGEGIAEGLETRFEEGADLLRGAMAALPEERRDLGMKVEVAGQVESLRRRLGVDPAFAECA